MKIENLKTHDQAVSESLRDPEYRAARERTALARAVAIAMVRYRADHHLSQRALAAQLGMKQPAIARLEAGDTNPSLDTLQKLAQGLDIAFHLEVTPHGLELSA